MAHLSGQTLAHLTRFVSSSEIYPEVSEKPLSVPSFPQNNSLEIGEHQQTSHTSDQSI